MTMMMIMMMNKWKLSLSRNSLLHPSLKRTNERPAEDKFPCMYLEEASTTLRVQSFPSIQRASEESEAQSQAQAQTWSQRLHTRDQS